MPITIRCPECGHAEPSADGASKTCPECEGTMTAPAKKPYQAKSKSLEEESRAKKKPRDEDPPRKKARPADDEDEPRPAKKAKAEPQALSLDDDDEGDAGAGEFRRDGTVAAGLEIDPGFTDKKLMRQVAEELSRNEVLYWAGRMCPEIAARNARVTLFLGLGVVAAGLVFSGIFFALAPWFVGLIPIIFVLVGVGVVVLGPKVVRKQAAEGWYAVTDQRAVVFAASAFGSGGQATTYEPHQLRRMRVKVGKSPKGAGDLVFKTKITERRTDYVDQRTGQTTRSETSRTETHYGFLGIEDVREVETLIHKVLLGGDDDDDNDDDE
jgi:hypothetical protein